MSASVNDYFQKLGGASSLVNTPKVTATRSAAGTTLTVDNCNWDTTTGKRFATFQVDTSGNVVSGTEIIWKGVVTGTTSIGSMARVSGASDTGNAIGDYVMLLPASDWANQLVAGILTHAKQDGTMIDSLPLTTPKVTTSLNDTNGNEVFKITATPSAVNEVTLTNAATGNNPSITATGGDSNPSIVIGGKGTGGVYFNPFGNFKHDTVAANETTTSASFTDLATVGPSVTVTIGPNGMALVILTSHFYTTSAGGIAYNGFVASGANTIAASATRSLLSKTGSGSEEIAASWIYLATGLTPGSTTFKMQYQVNAGTGNFSDRHIQVWAI